jgi:hypothetical protein
LSSTYRARVGVSASAVALVAAIVVVALCPTAFVTVRRNASGRGSPVAGSSGMPVGYVNFRGGDALSGAPLTIDGRNGPKEDCSYSDLFNLMGRMAQTGGVETNRAIARGRVPRGVGVGRARVRVHAEAAGGAADPRAGDAHVVRAERAADDLVRGRRVANVAGRRAVVRVVGVRRPAQERPTRLLKAAPKPPGTGAMSCV